MALQPPCDIEVGSVRLDREPYTDDVTLTMPDGSSYFLDNMGVEIWLKNTFRERLDDFERSRLVDALWNFYHLTLDCLTLQWTVQR